MSSSADDKAALFDQARGRERAGDLAGAITVLSQALARTPSDRDALLELARLSRVLNNPADARVLLGMVLASDSTDAEAWTAFAEACLGLHDGRTAELAARRLQLVDPGHRQGWILLAKALEQQGRHDPAGEAVRRLLAAHPTDPTALLEAGYFYRRHDRYGEATAVAHRLIEACPGESLGWVTLGVLHYHRGQPDQAEACVRRAIAMDPDCAPAHFSLACLDFAQGRWRQGFAGYRWRRRLPEAPPAPSGVPEWRGDEPAGTRVLVWNDLGLGDAIQFLRFVRQVCARGHHPLVMVAPSLVRLARTAPGGETAFAAGSPVPAVDARIALCDLPAALGLDDPSRFWSGPYLAAGEVPVLPPVTGRRVGLVWSGSPLHANDRKRSMGLTAALPWLDIAGIEWFSLQVGPRSTDPQGTPWQGRMRDMAPLIGDFADTAGIVRQLDLVITVDTSVVHLAGALGVRTWLLLPHNADWRWPAKGESTPWYPSVRLFRQSRPGDWSAVVEEVAQHLAHLF